MGVQDLAQTWVSRILLKTWVSRIFQDLSAPEVRRAAAAFGLISVFAIAVKAAAALPHSKGFASTTKLCGIRHDVSTFGAVF
jgi:hypothetical protein